MLWTITVSVICAAAGVVTGLFLPIVLAAILLGAGLVMSAILMKSGSPGNSSGIGTMIICAFICSFTIALFVTALVIHIS